MQSQNNLVFSFKDRKVIYFRVPKVASTSLLIAFRKFDEVEKCEDYENYKKYEKFYKFAFVRNPFDRLVSCFKHVIGKGAIQRINDNPELYRTMSFDDFLNVVEKTPIMMMDIHFRPQWTFIPETPDFLGKFESLEGDFAEICKKLGVSANLPHKNFTYKKHYREFYTKKSIEKVLKIYKKDFEIFGYKKHL